MILLIDNYDSFVYNLARYLAELGCETKVVRNDAITVDEVRERCPTAIILSPGPCTPDESGICVKLIRELGPEIPMLGVCLGHQTIAAAFCGRVIRAKEPVHGRTSQVLHDGTGLFAGLPQPVEATRYHSLIVDELALPASLRITAWLADGTIMGLEHVDWPLFGVQFHPESILTESGHRLLMNFLRSAGVEAAIPNGRERPTDRVDTDFYQQPIERDHPAPI